MHPEQSVVDAITASLQRELGDAPTWAVVLGSGLGPVRERAVIARTVSSTELGLPASTVPGHEGSISVGTLGGQGVAIVSGRIHAYEGHPMPTLVRYVRALAAWGVRRLVLTCSAGGISEGMHVGRLALISDHLNFTGRTPLAGPAFGTRFPDLSALYSPRLRAALSAAAASRGVPLQSGVYAMMMGPSYETPAEIRAVRTLGADLVGMSTVPEALAACEISMEVVGIALVSNRAAGLDGAELDHERVQEIAGKAAVQLAQLLEDIIDELAR